ncbi:hypothetical protein N7533_011668 [Penicillium manginii]|uniref:uncharacterized protein n=1 Tax=Penicillium manginii TaxID=203109 RepID=UPI002547F5AA|nr:uncharacterized protein N7533_011668 [Penicillium manginii]KAJ5742259.1 hypothetical protein N7533_011668 [Penicillium manginii]
MAQQGGEASGYRCSKLWRECRKLRDGLEGETRPSDHTDSSKSLGVSSTNTSTEHVPARLLAEKPGGKRKRRVRFELTERKQSPESIEFGVNDQAQSISSRA